jgi:hopanoid biosynthesis associated RND transporter like protein HpnN
LQEKLDVKRQQKEYSPRIIGWWVDFVQRHARSIFTVFIVATALVLLYSITHFKINMDVSGMISSKLHFRKVEEDFSKAFPNLSNTIVLVINAQSADLAVSSRDRLAEELRKQPALFKNVYVPGGGRFFKKNGLLYLSVSELEDFADNMAAVQPFLAFLSEDLSLRGLFSVFGKILEQPEERFLKDKRILLLFDEMERTLASAEDNRPYLMPWQEIMLGAKETAGQRQQFIIVQPVLDFTKMSAAEVPLQAVRSMIRKLGLNGEGGVTVHITGDLALDEENLREVRNSVGIATAASFILVALILYVGLWRSGRLIFACLATLVIGLIWTMGFAIFFIGSLNMISITFAVLFIGLGIDYSIQFCLRYRELIVSGSGPRESVIITARGVGRGLLFSCITTAIGFYSFLPTAYAGVAELGLISGTGMFISFFANLTFLPAMLTLVTVKEKAMPSESSLKRFLAVPYRYPRTITITALILGIGAAAFVPKVYFDYNPLDLYNPRSEAVQTIKDLFKDPEASPWTISVLVRGKEEAKKLAERLGQLKEVSMAITIFDFVPTEQSQKLAIISNVNLFMPRSARVLLKRSTCQQNVSALNAFERALKKALPSSFGESHASLQRLEQNIHRFKTLLKDPARGCKAFATLEQNMLSNFPDLFERLRLSLAPAPFRLPDVPRELAVQYVSSDGRYRVQAFPRQNIIKRDALVRFVDAVYSITPDATDAPVTVYESGMAVISSFRLAALLALAAITIFLLIEMRSFGTTVLILTPLILAMLLTAVSSVLFDIPLNFANVMVVPLLLGVGVHFGILFTLRYRTEPPRDGNMLTTSTARAMLFSSLTTMISTGSLFFSSHRGISSIGALLTLCFGFLIIGTLVLMPALLQLFGDRKKFPQKNRRS